MMNASDLVAIGMTRPRIDSGFSLEKDFSEFKRINPLMILYLTINQIDSCHGCACAPLA